MNYYGFKPQRGHINDQYGPRVRLYSSPRPQETNINIIDHRQPIPYGPVSDPVADRVGLFGAIGNLLNTLLGGLKDLFRRNPPQPTIDNNTRTNTNTNTNTKTNTRIQETDDIEETSGTNDTDDTSKTNDTTPTDDNTGTQDVLTNEISKVEDKSVKKKYGLYVWSYVMNNGNPEQSADIYCAHDENGNEVDLTDADRKALMETVTKNTDPDKACMGQDKNNPGNWRFKGEITLPSGKTVYLRSDYAARIGKLKEGKVVECHVTPIKVGGVTTYFKQEYKNGVAQGGKVRIDETEYNRLKSEGAKEVPYS